MTDHCRTDIRKRLVASISFRCIALVVSVHRHRVDHLFVVVRLVHEESTAFCEFVDGSSEVQLMVFWRDLPGFMHRTE